MKKKTTIQLLLAAPFILFTVLGYGQCDPPQAMCQDITITLDPTGNYTLTPAEVDNGSTADCGIQSISLDKTFFDCDDVNPVPQPFGDFQFEFGDTPPGDIDNAGTIALGPNGHIYVADINQEVIMHYDGAGTFLGTVGTQGFGVGQFANLRGIDVDASGNIYGTDDNREKVLVFNNLGAFQFEFGSQGASAGQFQNAWRISVNASGIHVLDNSRKKVIVFDVGGNFLFEFGSAGSNPGDFDVPTDIAHDSAGNIYILDAQRRKVIKFNSTGVFLSEFGQGPSGGIFEGRFDIVEGIAVGGNGNIYLADRSSGLNNNKIMVYDDTGNFIYEFGNSGTTNGKFNYTYSVAVDGNDRIYVSDLIRDNALVFDQIMAGNLVTLTVTDINGITSCCSAVVTVLPVPLCTGAEDSDEDGYSTDDGDCDDNNPAINPGAIETCNGIDDNCDGSSDEDLGVWVGDFIVASQADLDTFGSYTHVTGHVNILNTDVSDLSPLSCLRRCGQLNIQNNNNLLSLDGLQEMETIDGYFIVSNNTQLTAIDHLSSLTTVGINTQANDNSLMQYVSLPLLQTTGNGNSGLEIRNNPTLNSLSIPSMTSVDGLMQVANCPQLTMIDVTALDSVAQLELNQLPLSDLSAFSNVQSITGRLVANNLDNLTSMGAIDMIAIEGGFSILFNDQLTSLGTLGSVNHIDGDVYIQYNPALTTLEGMEDILSISGFLTVANNVILSDCCVIAELLESGNIGNTVTISNNPQFCSSENEIITFCLDNDGDGYTVNDGDCDDNNPAINPGMPETCNGIDDDCDSLVDLDDPELIDTIPPTFTGSLPSNISTDCNNIPDPITVSFMDNCAASMKFKQSSDWDGNCSNYTLTRTWTVTDGAENEISHEQLISVSDTQAPEFISPLPGDTTVTPGNVPPATSITASDNCSSGNHHYMEFDPIDASNASLVLTGTLDDINVIWNLEDVTTSQYKFRDIFTNNSLTTFSNASYFTPTSIGLDGAGFNAISGTAVLRISFDQPVENPVLHINNIDISRWDFSQTTSNISLLSGNDQFALENATVVDTDPSTSGGLNSGLGSIMFHGSFTELVATITLVDVTTDGIFLQLSAADDNVDVIFSEQTNPGSCPSEEIITRTWEATDGCGLMSSHTQTISVINSGELNIEDIILPTDPTALGNTISVSGTYSDSCDLDNHTASWIWGDGTSTSGTIDQVSNTVSGNHLYDSSGVYVVQLVVSNGMGSSDTLQATAYVVIYDPSGGFVTGGGWIQSPVGAYIPNPGLTGKANFGFVSKYKKGANIPTGNTQFKFNAAGFKFKSTSYEWLVIAGSKAKFKGIGKVNNQGNYGFMLTASDGDINGGGDDDKFRIKIWDKDQNDLVVYDNKLGSDDTGYDTQILGGGSITIHKIKGKSYAEADPATSAIDNENLELVMFPNPTSGIIQIEYEAHSKNTSLYIIDINGSYVHQFNNNAEVRGPQVYKWDASHLSEGIYFVMLVTSDSVNTKKFVVTK